MRVAEVAGRRQSWRGVRRRRRARSSPLPASSRVGGRRGEHQRARRPPRPPARRRPPVAGGGRQHVDPVAGAQQRGDRQVGQPDRGGDLTRRAPATISPAPTTPDVGDRLAGPDAARRAPDRSSSRDPPRPGRCERPPAGEPRRQVGGGEHGAGGQVGGGDRRPAPSAARRRRRRAGGGRSASTRARQASAAGGDLPEQVHRGAGAAEAGAPPDARCAGAAPRRVSGRAVDGRAGCGRPAARRPSAVLGQSAALLLLLGGRGRRRSTRSTRTCRPDSFAAAAVGGLLGAAGVEELSACGCRCGRSPTP